MNKYEEEAKRVWEQTLSKIESWDSLLEIYKLLESQLRGVGYLAEKKFTLQEIHDKLNELEEET
jgi:hypothetical protein